MRLDEPIEAKGNFWLPESPDVEVSGTLYISESGEVTLETIGHLGGTEGAIERLKSYEGSVSGDRIPTYRVLGYNERLGFIKLENCFLNEPLPSIGPRQCKASADYALIGSSDLIGQDVSFSRFAFSLEELDEWLHISGFSIEPYNLSSPEFNVRFKPPESITVPLFDGLELTIGFSWVGPSTSLNITEVKMSQTAYFSLLSSDAKDATEFISIASMMRDFISLGVGKPVLITSTEGFSEDIYRILDDGSKYKLPIKIYHDDGYRSDSRRSVLKRHMAFAYDDISSKLGTILSNWITSHKKYKTPFSLFFQSISDDSQLDLKFLRIVQAMEILHRGYFNEQDVELRRRLTRIFNSTLSSRIKNKRRKKLVNDVVATRNYLTHYSDERGGEIVNNGYFYVLTELLSAVFQLWLMQIIGFDDGMIDGVLKRNVDIRNRLAVFVDAKDVEVTDGFPPTHNW